MIETVFLPDRNVTVEIAAGERIEFEGDDICLIRADGYRCRIWLSYPPLGRVAQWMEASE